jgi:hypothetical protein
MAACIFGAAGFAVEKECLGASVKDTVINAVIIKIVATAGLSSWFIQEGFQVDAVNLAIAQ